MVSVRQVVVEVLGERGDETILDYVITALEDEDFEFGQGGEEAYEQFGEMVVEGGFVDSDEVAKSAFEEIARKLRPDQNSDSKTVNGGFRALESGPVQLKGVKDTKVPEAKDPNKIVKDMITSTKDSLFIKTEKDEQKLEKRRAKEEQKIQAIQRQMREEVANAHKSKPTIVRDQGGAKWNDIHLQDISVSNGGAELIGDCNVTLANGRRYGVIGRNGTGKTTFLRTLAARSIKGLPKSCQVLHVEQEIVGDDTPVIQSVLECDDEREKLLAREREIEGILQSQQPDSAQDNGAKKGVQNIDYTAELNKIYTRMEEIDGYNAKARAAMLLSGLSFTDQMMEMPTKSLSGGWRMRVSLARALFVEPDLLLLDEPTNHLDLHAVLWLEDYLIKWPKTLLIVSHAREFLNAVCTDILHLHSRKLVLYKGDFDTFEKTMRERVKNQLKLAENQEQKRKHMQEFIDKFRCNAKRASMVQSRIKALNRMTEVQVAERDPEYVFTFPKVEATLPPPVISFQDVDFNYPNGPTLYRGINFGIDLESRLAIVGPNGVGKSTLLNLICGKLDPVKGTVFRNPGVRMAVFSQHHVDGLDLTLSPLTYMMKEYPNVKEPIIRGHLSSFGVQAELAMQQMYTMSGGQKSRVAFAKVTFSKPHILLLDEPSNHLDMDAVEALVEGLTLYQGGVLMVSHDQFLIESTVDELWMVEAGTITPFYGTFEEYKKRLRTKSYQK